MMHRFSTANCPDRNDLEAIASHHAIIFASSLDVTMQLFHRISLTVSLAVVGAAIGFFSAAFLMPGDAGLAGGAAVLMAGLAGLLVGAAIGLLAGFYITPHLCARVNTVALPAAILLSAAFAAVIWRNADRVTDPESAYANLPSFRVVFEQTTITDPNLATSIRVDTASRSWQIVLADGRICTGGLRAEAQESVGKALIVMRDNSDRTKICNGYDGRPVQVLKWRLGDATGNVPEKRFELPSGCSETGPVIAPLVRNLRLIPSIAETKTVCN